MTTPAVLNILRVVFLMGLIGAVMWLAYLGWVVRNDD